MLGIDSKVVEISGSSWEKSCQGKAVMLLTSHLFTFVCFAACVANKD